MNDIYTGGGEEEEKKINKDDFFDFITTRKVEIYRFFHSALLFICMMNILWNWLEIRGSSKI